MEYREEVGNRELTRVESGSLDRYNNVAYNSRERPNYDGMSEHGVELELRRVEVLQTLKRRKESRQRRLGSPELSLECSTTKPLETLAVQRQNVILATEQLDSRVQVKCRIIQHVSRDRVATRTPHSQTVSCSVLGQ